MYLKVDPSLLPRRNDEEGRVDGDEYDDERDALTARVSYKNGCAMEGM